MDTPTPPQRAIRQKRRHLRLVVDGCDDAGPPPAEPAGRCADVSGEIVSTPVAGGPRPSSWDSKIRLARPRPSWSGEEIFRRYKLVRRIGVGEQSEVFEAEDLRTGRRVALKRAREERERDYTVMDSLTDEAAALHTSTSFLVEVVNPDFAFDYSIVVMAMATGTSLARYLELWGAVNLELAIRIGANLCHVVRRLREAKFEVSRVKPTDVFIKRGRYCRSFPDMTVVGFDVRRLGASKAPSWGAELKAVASLVRAIAFPEGSAGSGDRSVSTPLRRALDIAEGRDPDGLRYPTINGLLQGLLRAQRGEAPE